MIELTRARLLDEAREVAEEYRDDGYDLTLRQLYYQLVSKAIIPNSDTSYKRLGDTLGDARLRGVFDMDLLVDRGRNAQASKHVECKVNVNRGLAEAASLLGGVPHWAIAVDRWFGQRTHVSVWVEKEALAGVFQAPCEEMGVGLFACKGYPSHSALWQWLRQLELAYITTDNDVENDAEDAVYTVPGIDEAVVLYFGDHDPDGWQIPRSAEATLNTLAEVHGLDIPPIRFERVALNMDQIQTYRPPPFPAKPTSSRFAGYVEEHDTQSAWELDALSPRVLDALIRENVEDLFDVEAYERWQLRAHTCRERLKNKMRDSEWILSVL